MTISAPQIKRRYAGLDSFTQDEASSVASLAGSLHTVENELTELVTRSKNELVKVLGPSGTVLELESMRNALVSVEAEGVETCPLVQFADFRFSGSNH